MPKRADTLTTKQQRFVDAYDGNATEAARVAGYKQPRVQGAENLTKPYIAAAIQARETKKRKKVILSREDRQEFWSLTTRGQVKIQGEVIDAPVEMRDRLAASKLLGQSEGDFITRTELTGKDGAELAFAVLPPALPAPEGEVIDTTKQLADDHGGPEPPARGDE